ncbi:hypothetical protein NPIL_17901, partial [Nephila pilipes]
MMKRIKPECLALIRERGRALTSDHDEIKVACFLDFHISPDLKQLGNVNSEVVIRRRWDIVNLSTALCLYCQKRAIFHLCQKLKALQPEETIMNKQIQPQPNFWKCEFIEEENSDESSDSDEGYEKQYIFRRTSQVTTVAICTNFRGRHKYRNPEVPSYFCNRN